MQKLDQTTIEQLDNQRLENLNAALETQLSNLEYAKRINNYIKMSEYASNIHKLAYTINYIQNNNVSRS